MLGAMVGAKAIITYFVIAFAVATMKTGRTPRQNGVRIPMPRGVRPALSPPASRRPSAAQARF